MAKPPPSTTRLQHVLMQIKKVSKSKQEILKQSKIDKRIVEVFLSDAKMRGYLIENGGVIGNKIYQITEAGLLHIENGVLTPKIMEGPNKKKKNITTETPPKPTQQLQKSVPANTYANITPGFNSANMPPEISLQAEQAINSIGGIITDYENVKNENNRLRHALKQIMELISKSI